MKKTLHNITEDTLSLYSEIEAIDGELTPEMEEALKINKDELSTKGISYIEFIGSQESLNDRIDVEIKRLTAMKKKNANVIEYLKFNLLEAQKIHGDFECGFKTVSTRKSKSIEVEDINKLPKKYKVIKVVESANKALLKIDLEKGIKIKGVTQVEKKNLNIK